MPLQSLGAGPTGESSAHSPSSSHAIVSSLPSEARPVVAHLYTSAGCASGRDRIKYALYDVRTTQREDERGRKGRTASWVGLGVIDEMRNHLAVWPGDQL